MASSAVRCLKCLYTAEAQKVTTNIVMRNYTVITKTSYFQRNDLYHNRKKLLYNTRLEAKSTLEEELMKFGQFSRTSIIFKRRKSPEERKQHRMIEYSPKPEVVQVWRGITLAELSKILNKDNQFIKDLFLNQIKNFNQPIEDLKYLQEGIRRAGKRIQIIGSPNNNNKTVDEVIEKDITPRPPPKKEDLQPRPPVVAVMGHVDHGKTTLLDALRHSSVVDKEFGGITQHIGAFSVLLESGARITFIDTPGHAAFSSMRARGANLTDIVVLVVAADDGVMEQTIESVKMARTARVPILVAINKIDSPKADIEAALKMLLDIGIQVEQLGGDVQAVPISALKKQNLHLLTEALVLQAELLEIGGDPKGPVEGVVVESNVHTGRGKIATLVVQRGTLKKGNILVAGLAMAKVRTMRDANGKILTEVSPGYPVEVEGWRDLPAAGEVVLQVDSEKIAKDVIKFRETREEEKKIKEEKLAILQKQESHESEYKERLLMKRKLGRLRMRPEGPRKPQFQEDDSPSLNVIIKTDVDGTLEAILETLDTYESDDCELDIVHYGVGPLTHNELELAKTFNCIVYCFNTEIPTSIKNIINEEKLDIRPHNVIYKLIDDVRNEINKRLPSKEVEEILGKAQVLQEIEISKGRKKVTVAGCKCTQGTLKKDKLFRVERNGEVIFEGSALSMRHLKTEMDSIKEDTDCGIQLSSQKVKYEKGDTIVCFERKTIQQQTEWDPGF